MHTNPASPCSINVHIACDGDVNITNYSTDVASEPTCEPPCPPPASYGLCVPVSPRGKRKLSRQEKLGLLAADNQVPSALAASMLHTLRRCLHDEAPATPLEGAIFDVCARGSASMREALSCAIASFDTLPADQRTNLFDESLMGDPGQAIDVAALADAWTREIHQRAAAGVFGDPAAAEAERPGRIRVFTGEAFEYPGSYLPPQRPSHQRFSAASDRLEAGRARAGLRDRLGRRGTDLHLRDQAPARLPRQRGRRGLPAGDARHGGRCSGTGGCELLQRRRDGAAHRQAEPDAARGPDPRVGGCRHPRHRRDQRGEGSRHRLPRSRSTVLRGSRGPGARDLRVAGAGAEHHRRADARRAARKGGKKLPVPWWAWAIAAGVGLALDAVWAWWAPADPLIRDTIGLSARDLAVLTDPTLPMPEVQTHTRTLELLGQELEFVDRVVTPIEKIPQQYRERREHRLDGRYALDMRYTRLA